jgi:hypothetical protein
LVADRPRVFKGIRFKGGVVRAGQILQGASRRNAFTSLGCGRGLLLPIGFTLGDFRVGQNLFAGIATGRCNGICLGPEALQVRSPMPADGGIAPDGFASRFMNTTAPSRQPPHRVTRATVCSSRLSSEVRPKAELERAPGQNT